MYSHKTGISLISCASTAAITKGFYWPQSLLLERIYGPSPPINLNLIYFTQDVQNATFSFQTGHAPSKNISRSETELIIIYLQTSQ